MIELLGALIGGGASIAGGIMGAGAQDRASEQNWKINLLNYYSRERERQDRIRQAGIERRDRHLGATDSNGNRVHFVPGQGWVSELSAQGKSMNDAQNNEQMNTLLVDLPMRRRQMQENFAGQQDDKYLAEGALAAYKRGGELPQGAGARAYTAAQQGTNANWDNIVNSMMRSATRQGNSNTGKMINDLMVGRAAEASMMGARARAAGEQAGAQNESGRAANYLNIFNALSGRSRGMPATQYTPQNVAGTADKMLQNNQSLAADAGNQLTAAYGQKGGSLDYVEPNYGWANAVSGGGQALGSAFGNIASSLQKRQAGGNKGY